MKKRRVIKTKNESNESNESLEILKIISGESNVNTIETNLQPIRYVPTIFTSFNRAIVLGGAPIRTTWLVHGPPGSGKTAFAIGIANSFVKQNHFAGILDAEHAMSKKWVEDLNTYTKGILYEQPDNFEHGVAITDKWITNFKKGKKEGIIREDAAFVIVVDTIHKMLPKKAMATLVEMTNKQSAKLDENINKGWGRYRANMISTWIDTMTPIVGKNDIIFMVLAHEYETQAESKSFFSSGDDYKIKGGQTLLFEAMVRLRTTMERKIYEQINGVNILVGREHKIMVEKNKVGFPFNSGSIYIGNGKGKMPLGFDLEREAVFEALSRDSLIKNGAWITVPYDQELKFQGGEQLITFFRENKNQFELFVNYLNEEI